MNNLLLLDRIKLIFHLFHHQKLLSFFLLIILICSCSDVHKKLSDGQIQQEKKIIKQVINDNIGWALTKNLSLLYSTLMQDSTLLIINPDESMLEGFDEVEETTESFWMDPRFKATHSEIKNLRISISKSGNTAWYFCYLDDFGEWDGREYKWENARWTGVLEKVKGKWVICQMHISFPN